MTKPNYRHTLAASYIGYITQAIINNFPTLLYLTFQSRYGVSLVQISLLISLNFGTQLLVDLASACFVDRIGYRFCLVAAHIFSFSGLCALAFLPDLLPSPFIGLLISYLLSAIGGGLIEVLISPLVEACPTENKSAHMSLLHSFYCWGVVGLIALSTLYFSVFGTEKWQILTLIWAILPLFNAFFFLKVPIVSLSEEKGGMTVRQVFSHRIFYLLALLMVCAGAAELAVAQWASAFAEAGLNVNKSVGDLAGPCMFAVLMGSARILSSKLSKRISVQTQILASAILCILAYLLASLSPNPVLALIGCALCGFSVGVLWPGTYSIASLCCPGGGTALFALLALAGDLGCVSGPLLVGMLSGQSGQLSVGLSAAIVFPIAIVLVMLLFGRRLGWLGRAKPSARSAVADKKE